MLIVEESTTTDNRSSVVFWSPPGRPNRPTGSGLTASSIPTIGRARSTVWSMRNLICGPSFKVTAVGEAPSPPGSLDQDVALRTRPWHDSAHQVASRPLRKRAAAVAAHGLGSQSDLAVRIPRPAESFSAAMELYGHRPSDRRRPYRGGSGLPGRQYGRGQCLTPPPLELGNARSADRATGTGRFPCGCVP